MLISKIHNFWKQNLSRKLEANNLIEVSRSAILHNYNFIQNLHPQYQIWPVLKSNAYGHGIKQVAKILQRRRFEYIVVDSYYEALKIWEVSNQKVLLINFPPFQNLRYFNYSRLSLIVYNQDLVHELGKLNRKIKIHLKLNTGLNRQGIKPEEIDDFLKMVREYPQLEVEGVCSHLASADDEKENDYTQMQENRFIQAINKIRQAGFNPKYIHLSNTPGTVKIKNEVCNTIRLGLGLYGINPIDQNDSQKAVLEKLKPALRFTSKVINFIELERGERVSYAGTFTAPKKMKIILLPIGYYEAYTRRMSNRVMAKHNGVFLPQVGNICMNLTLFSCGNQDIKVGDTVEVISPNHADLNSVYELAKLDKTIPYEILVNLAEPIRRTIVDTFDNS